jgi:hypothetical protein
MPTALVKRARLFVDSRAGAFSESGDVLLPMAEGGFGPDHIAAELGEVAASRATGRTGPGEVTIFKSLGMAVEDVVAARLAVERARRGGSRPVVRPCMTRAAACRIGSSIVALALLAGRLNTRRAAAGRSGPADRRVVRRRVQPRS